MRRAKVSRCLARRNINRKQDYTTHDQETTTICLCNHKRGADDVGSTEDIKRGEITIDTVCNYCLRLISHTPLLIDRKSMPS